MLGGGNKMKESDICPDRSVKVNQARKGISRLSPRTPTKFHIRHSCVALNLIDSRRHGRPRQAQAHEARCPRAAAGGRGEEGIHAPDVPLPPRRQRLRRRLRARQDLLQGPPSQTCRFCRCNVWVHRAGGNAGSGQAGGGAFAADPRGRAAPGLQVDAGGEAQGEAPRRRREEEARRREGPAQADHPRRHPPGALTEAEMDMKLATRLTDVAACACR